MYKNYRARPAWKDRLLLAPFLCHRLQPCPTQLLRLLLLLLLSQRRWPTFDQALLGVGCKENRDILIQTKRLA